MTRIKRLITTVMSEDWLKSALILTLLAVGCIGLWYGCRMAYKFGMGMSHEHAVTLVLVSILAAVAFPASDFIARQGWTGLARLAKGVGVVFMCMEFITHMGYAFGQRHQNVTAAAAQQVNHQGQQEATAEQRRRLAVLEQDLADLTKANGWAATVTAVGLREKLDSLQKAVDLEAARGGCKTVCLQRMKERDDVKDRIATIERRSTLQTEIAQVKRELDAQRNRLASTDLGNSAVIEQTVAFAKIAHWSLTPDEDTKEWTKYILGVLIAFCTVLISPAAFWLAFVVAGMAGLAGIAQHVAPRVDEPANSPSVSANSPAAEREAPVIRLGKPDQPKLYTQTIAQLRRQIAAAA